MIFLKSKPKGRYKFGLLIKHQQYCNYQLRLWADGTRIPQQRQAFSLYASVMHHTSDTNLTK